MGSKKLRLGRETVGELAPQDLAMVGAGLSERICVAATPFCISDMAISLCDCLTQWCSIDVC